MFENLFNKVSERIGDTLQQYNVPSERLPDVLDLAKNSLECGLTKEIKAGHTNDLIDNLKDPNPEAGRVVTLSKNELCQKLEQAGLDARNAQRVSDSVIGEAFQEITTKAQQQNISDEEGLKGLINSESQQEEVSNLSEYSESADSRLSKTMDQLTEGLKDLFNK